jgi:rfaE bifunctional protein kinase chain/domain
MSEQSFEEIFSKFDNLNVLIIGDVMVDAYIWGEIERMSPEAPVPVVRVTKKDFRLGGAANVALNIKAMGANPILCSLVGNDADGEKFADRLADRNITDQGIHRSSTRPTTVKTRVISDNKHIVRIDEESTEVINEHEKQGLLANIEKLLPQCQVVIFEDYDKGCISPEVIAFTVDLANQHNIPTVVDPKKRNFLAYKGVSLFKPNLKELKEGLEIDFDVTKKEELQTAVVRLTDALQCGGAFITLSEHGVYIANEEVQHHIPAHLRKIIDVSGAGDTVISIAALCVALGLPPYLVAALANLGGGLVCEHVGVVTIDRNLLMTEAIANLNP